MGKQAKPKQDSGARAENRSNGKAPKQNPGRKGHGSRRTPLTEGQKILMGKGLYVKFERMNAEGARVLAGKKSRD